MVDNVQHHKHNAQRFMRGVYRYIFLRNVLYGTLEATQDRLAHPAHEGVDLFKGTVFSETPKST